MFDFHVIQAKNREEALAIANSEPFLSHFKGYIDRIMNEAQEGLSPEDKEIYVAIWSGKMEQRKDGKELYDWNPKVYDALMWSCSMGLG